MEKTTTETLMAGEKIIEALEISDEDRLQLQGHEETLKGMTEEAIERMAPRKRNPIFSIYEDPDMDPEIHVLKVVQKVSSASLNDALLVLPFAQVTSMLKHVDYWVERVSIANRFEDFG